MKKFILLFIVSLVAVSCGVFRKCPSSNELTIYNYVDSVMFHDSTIYTYIPVEKIRDVVPQYDTLRMETSVATSVSYVDTATHTLKGSLINKEDSIKTTIKWKEKIVHKDSIVTKDVPYPVEVPVPVKTYPKSYWFFIVYFILTILLSGIAIYLKL